jgi:hypothetical protein
MATPEQMAKLEREMDKVQGQYQQAEQTYGADLLHLVVAKGYLTKLLANEAVRRYLTQHQPEILDEFQALVDTVALNPGASEMETREDEGETSANPDHREDQTAEVITLAVAA